MHKLNTAQPQPLLHSHYIYKYFRNHLRIFPLIPPAIYIYVLKSSTFNDFLPRFRYTITETETRNYMHVVAVLIPFSIKYTHTQQTQKTVLTFFFHCCYLYLYFIPHIIHAIPSIPSNSALHLKCIIHHKIIFL